jgi:hypothetical protein
MGVFFLLIYKEFFGPRPLDRKHLRCCFELKCFPFTQLHLTVFTIGVERQFGDKLFCNFKEIQIY